jgi:molybdopterin-guanine dinucleotide biosynthesis protein A
MLFTKAEITGQVKQLLVGRDRAKGIEKEPADKLDLRFDGIAGDFHAGFTAKSGSDLVRLHPRGTALRNVRHASLVSVEELASIAAAMNVPMVKAEWLGANIVTTGIPDLTLVPPSTRLQFPSGATLVVDLENEPCRQPADIIRKYYPEQALSFVKAAEHKRGLSAWVEREGPVNAGDAIVMWLPPQRIYSKTVRLLQEGMKGAPAADLALLVGCILAGGQSRRMGGQEKALLHLGGKTLLDRVIDRVAPQVQTLVLNANGDPSRFAGRGLPVITDSIAGFAGPLAGILTGLEWAIGRGAYWMVSIPSDTPFLPPDLVMRLSEARRGNDIACAMSGSRAHPVIGLWSTSLAADLRRALIAESIRKVDAWTARYRIGIAEWPSHPYDPFFNINRPADLAEAERILRECNP